MNNRINTQIKIPGLVVLFLLLVNIASAQVKYQNAGVAKVAIDGTSNIHDWTMNADKASCAATFTIGTNNALTAVTGLGFAINVESLKSEHKAMDKNTYKAMNTDKYPTITFTAATATVKPAGGANYTVTAHGKLTISGTTKDVDVTATCTVNADKSVTCNGSYKLNMTQYNVTPPSIMFGMIKVGDPITVRFSFLMKP
jgi:polyisoprenoid-binding protein YceI